MANHLQFALAAVALEGVAAHLSGRVQGNIITRPEFPESMIPSISSIFPLQMITSLRGLL
jgi:hypothetical protein